MPTGRIKRIFADRGFGFIQPDDGSGDVFFHMRGLAFGMEFDERLLQLDVRYTEVDRLDRGAGSGRSACAISALRA